MNEKYNYNNFFVIKEIVKGQTSLLYQELERKNIDKDFINQIIESITRNLNIISNCVNHKSNAI